MTSSSWARDVIFCTHLGFEPYVIRNKRQLHGIDIEILVQTLKNERLSSEIKAYPWPRLIAALQDGSCDFGFSLFDTEERRKFAEYLFTVPIHYSTFSVFVKKGNEFNYARVSDFFGKTIGHNEGFSLTVGLEQAIASQRIKRITFNETKKGINLLKKGDIDVLIGNDARFRYFMKTQKMYHQFSVLNLPFLPHHPAFLVLSKKSTLENAQEIKHRLQAQLRELHLDGTIMDITTNYLR